MKSRLILSLIVTVVIFILLEWQGQSLITPVSRHGILDLEFAKTTDRLQQLQLFLNGRNVQNNLYLDFAFIIAYSWFLYTACRWAGRNNAVLFGTLSLSAGLFDIFENLLLLMIFYGRFSPSLIALVYYVALIKFILLAVVILYLLYSIPFLFLKGKKR